MCALPVQCDTTAFKHETRILNSPDSKHVQNLKWNDAAIGKICSNLYSQYFLTVVVKLDKYFSLFVLSFNNGTFQPLSFNLLTSVSTASQAVSQ